MSALSFRPGIWDGEPAMTEETPPDWLWHGYLAGGKVTMLTSLWKSGKTTLVSLLLARRAMGGELAGLAVSPGVSAVISEEDSELWSDRGRRLNFRGRVCFFCQPFDRRPTFAQWTELLDHLVDLRQSKGLNLVVVDTLASFLPGGNENSATIVQDALQPLRKLTRCGMSVLLLHHPRKGSPQLGHSPRGSGALSSFPDICLEMGHPAGDPFSRRRILQSLSRFADTPRSRTMELNANGDDYIVCDAAADEFRANWDVLVMTLEEAHHPLTRREILADWPPDFPKPCDNTVWRWLTRAAELGLARSEGTGRKNDPFRYWLPANEAKWQSDPFYAEYQNRKDMAKLFEQRNWR